MPSLDENAERIARDARKEQRQREADLAMQEYEAERLAVHARTQRLRAARLAKEAADAKAAEAEVKTSAKAATAKKTTTAKAPARDKPTPAAKAKKTATAKTPTGAGNRRQKAG